MTNTPIFTCPYCSQPSFAFANLTGQTPTPGEGDVGVCDGCFNVYRFAHSSFGGLVARRLSVDEAWMVEDPRVKYARDKLIERYGEPL